MKKGETKKYCDNGHPLFGYNLYVYRERTGHKYERRVCRLCHNKRQRTYRNKHRDKILPTQRERQRRAIELGLYRENWRRNHRANYAKHFHKDQARHKLREAIKSGKINKPKVCERCHALPHPNRAGASQLHGHHHRGYGNPFDVIWLCSNCHLEEHSTVRREP